MKKYQLLTLSFLAMSVIACDSGEETVWDDPNFVRISVSSEAIKVSGTENYEIDWNRDEEIMVFDQNNTGVSLKTTDNGVTGVFYSHEWSGNTPSYAAYPVESVSGAFAGILSVNLPAEQEISARQTYGKGAIVSVGKVTGNSSAYKISPMMNVMGILKVSMVEPAATSITVEPVNVDEIIAGNVDVDYAKLESGDPAFWTAAEGNAVKKVTITPAEGSEAATESGCFASGAYYFSILPQTYTEGLKITVTYNDGTTLERYIGKDEGITIPRSGIAAFGSALDDTLPEVIEINLVFYNEENVNPLGTFVPAAQQKVAGEEYIYQYKYIPEGNSMEMTEDFVFTISKGASGATYQYAKPSNLKYNIFMFAAQNNGYIQLPGIPERYLKSVSLSVGNTSQKRFRLQETSNAAAADAGKTKTSPWATATSATTPAVATVSFPNDASDGFGNLANSEIGRSYYMMLTAGASLRVFEINLVYTKSEPTADPVSAE